MFVKKLLSGGWIKGCGVILGYCGCGLIFVVFCDILWLNISGVYVWDLWLFY